MSGASSRVTRWSSGTMRTSISGVTIRSVRSLWVSEPYPSGGIRLAELGAGAGGRRVLGRGAGRGGEGRDGGEQQDDWQARSHGWSPMARMLCPSSAIPCPEELLVSWT